MTQMTLYTGNGVSLSPQYAEGRIISAYVRLIADDDMGITDGVTITTCIDTKIPDMWSDCELPPIPEDDEDATAEDYENALGRFGV